MSEQGDAYASDIELWKAARQQLNEYELRTAELQQELQQELRACQSAKDNTARINKDISQLRAAKTQHDSHTVTELARIKALSREKELELSDTQRLVQQLEVMRHKLAAAEKKMEADRASRAEHIQEQQSHNAGLRQLLEPSAA